MDETMQTSTPTPSVPECRNCALHMEEQKKNEETSIAFLVALTPVLAITFFNMVGLFQ